MSKPLTIHADVTTHHGPLGWVAVAKLTTPAGSTRTTQRQLSAAMYRVAAELETALADGAAPDGDCLGYTVDVRGPQLEMGLSATVRLVLTDGDMPVDVAYAEEMVIDACVACGLEPEHAGSGPLDR
jgi:hypothetical protein